MIDLCVRSHQPEWMDGEDVTEAEFAACLRDLATVNTLTLARPPTLAFVAQALARTAPDRVLTLVDVGYGAGDMLRAIHKLAARKGRTMRLIGLDINPRSLPAARAATPPDMAIDYRTGDAFLIPAEEPIDLIVSSLVTHHMDDAGIVRFLRWMEGRAQSGWFVNDLHRHALPYHVFRLFSAAMRWHPFVRHDGPLSIARAFHREDWNAFLAQAGVADVAEIYWRFPFRYCVSRWQQ
ncbi:MAG TPA: methyltransferase domain-containing protein [Sphingobium sp.]|uniref:methyltransferase domain-containing protein n=1 Tax=Sphingobium sp. TaxID=1912891 RepID=UPI002ED35C44